MSIQFHPYILGFGIAVGAAVTSLIHHYTTASALKALKAELLAKLTSNVLGK